MKKYLTLFLLYILMLSQTLTVDAKILFENNETEAYYTNDARTAAYYKYYTGIGRNRLYLTNMNYTFFYGAVAPAEVTTGAYTVGHVYNNAAVRPSAGSISGWATRNHVYNTTQGNFKSKATKLVALLNPEQYGFNVKFENGHYLETSDRAVAGKMGEWRYLGHNTTGNGNGNPIFPEDYSSGGSTKLLMTSSVYVDNPWNVSTGAAGKYVPGTVYDIAAVNSQDWKKKYEAVKLLLAQNKLSTSDSSVRTWMRRLSLTSEPLEGSANFRAAWSGNKYYVEWTLINAKVNKNLAVTHMTIYDTSNGRLVGEFKRSSIGSRAFMASIYPDADGFRGLYAGRQYEVRANVTNRNTEGVIRSPLQVNIHFTDDYTGAPLSNASSGQLVSGRRLNAVESDIVRHQFTPNSSSITGKMRVGVVINRVHRSDGDNLRYEDDEASLILPVLAPKGDMYYNTSYLINRNGDVEQNPAPGQEYRIRHEYVYEGPHIQYHYSNCSPNGFGGFSCFPYTYAPRVTMVVTSTTQMRLPYNSTDQSTESITLESTVQTGNIFHFTTSNYFLYELPDIKTSTEFTMTEDGFNPDKSNDRGLKHWSENYDIRIANIQVAPKTERITMKKNRSLVVALDVVNTMPTTASNIGYESLVNIRFTINSNTYVRKAYLKNGLNSNLTFEFNVPDLSLNDRVDVTAHVNYDRKVWEKEFNSPPANPNGRVSTAFNADWVEENGLNYNNAGLMSKTLFPKQTKPSEQGFAVRTRNTWNNTQITDVYMPQQIGYYTPSGIYRTHYKYSSATRNNYSTTTNFFESFVIKHVYFRSKYTVDNNMGTTLMVDGRAQSGWVDMLRTVPRIKAGYGYEVRIVTEYQTNAISQGNNSLGDTIGVQTRPYHYKPNIEEDVFLRTSRGEIISKNGARNTRAGLRLVSAVQLTVGDVYTKTMTFTLKTNNSTDLSDVGRIYLSEDTRDGDYGLEVWTIMTAGMGTKGAGVTSPESNSRFVQQHLADFADSNRLRFEVKGSMKDDVINTIIQ